MRLMSKDQKWRKKEDGTMELMEETEVEIELEVNYTVEEYLLDLEFRVSMMELGLGGIQ